MIKAVIFDFDGLIIDTESIWYEAYGEVLKERGFSLSLEVFSRIIGQMTHHYMKLYTHKGEQILNVKKLNRRLACVMIP